MSRPRKTLKELYLSRVVKGDGCWGWVGKRDTFGYGVITLYDGAPRTSAHRVSWMIHYGIIPESMFVFHKCDNPPCSNPEHLFIGTHIDNMRDAVQKGRHRTPPNKWVNQTHCVNGHLFDERNTYMYKCHRFCRKCRAAAEARRRDRILAVAI